MFLAFAALSYAADDQYKPYLHKASVPENPKPKLYGAYSTNLFPGAGTYSYPIEIPKGTNNLQPSISISYNSQSVKQRPSILGAGWSLTQNYIYRDVNSTPSNVTDDTFKLILSGASYNLIYDSNDGFYHTEMETFARVQNLSNAPNTYNMYWLVTLKDGTQLRLGYNTDSELTSNVGYNYALKWSLDQIQDTRSNKIFYSYREDPFPDDNGTSYLDYITYNNDQKRKIEFGYESSVRPDRRLVFEHGNKLEESRRLSDITVLFNSTLVRRYNFEFINLNNESSLSSLSKINYIGADNSSILHAITFGNYQPTPYYTNSTTYNTSVLFSNSDREDYGVRLIDLNNDGYIDMLQGRGSTSNKSAWINNKTGWVYSSDFAPPEFFVYNEDPDVGLDKGLRIADLNNDGFADLIQGRGGTKKVWLNNGSGWKEDILTWPLLGDSTFTFANTNGIDQGLQLVDFNGDGKIDLLQAKQSISRKAYLNTGNGWRDVGSQWESPTDFVDSSGNDLGARLVDVNSDGLVDILKGKDATKEAWLNNGSGWVSSSVWIPPDVFTSTTRADNGIRFIDLDGDGLTDILEDFANGSTTSRGAWINTGSGWTNSSSWISPEAFTKDGKNTGRRIGDVNGDGFGDIIIGYNDGSDIKRTAVRNSTIPYLLKNITNEFGGTTYLDYSTSTSYNNTGDDGLSDIGFNLWIVNTVLQNNSLNSDFNVFGNTSYNYFWGLYDYNDAEFRGFNIVNETLSDKSTITHYFNQSKQLKGKEYRTETYDLNSNIFSSTENNFNFTAKNNGIFVNNLLFSTSYTFDGNSINPRIINVSYAYDNYSNLINKINLGDVSVSGDEKYENYTYSTNTSSWILGKVSWYLLFDSNYNKIRETKYSYDNHQYGDPPSKGELTKVESYLNTGGGNPTTSYVYDDFGNLYKQTDSLGRTTIWDYGIGDDTFTYSDRITNALGHATDYVYDVGTGNVLSYAKNGITTAYQYDTFGRVIKDIDPYDTSDFPTKSYTYNFDGVAPETILIKQRTTSNNSIDAYYFYDGFANLVQIKSPADYGQQAVKNLFYDGLFRVSSEQNPYFDSFNVNLSTASNITNRTRYNYDSVGRIISVINPDGTNKNTTFNKSVINDYDENQNRHTYTLDSYGRIIQVQEYNNDYYILDNQTFNTTYSYNGADELTGIRDNYGNNFNFSYDSLGRKIKLNDPDLGTWQYSYDNTGNLIKQVDNKGNQILISYDQLNRILFKNTSSQVISFAYDQQYQGTLSNISFGNESYAYTYDDRLRVTKELLKIRNQIFETGMAYDSMDRILQKRLPDASTFDIYYSPQNKIQKINEFINDTKYSPFGNPLNRTYFNNKLTTFDYYSDNIRLRQIKTDTIQQLNYTYDNVGNILSINDSTSNRSYSMSYDNLDRLTNVTISGYTWIYSYDAIGNILKIIRNNTETTFLKYNGAIPHAPSKVVTQDAGVDVYRISISNGTNRSQTAQFYLVNEKNQSLSQVNYSVEFGDNSIINSAPLSLAYRGFSLISVEHNYTSGGNYIVNITGRANTTSSDYESLKLLFGTLANSLSILKQNGSLVVAEFDALNNIGDNSLNWGWNCSNGLISNVPFNMSSSQNLMVIIENNFTVIPSANLTCQVNSTDGNQSYNLPFNFDNIKIENYNSSLTGANTILVKFQITNYYSTLNNINWSITSDNLLYNASGISLSQGQSTSISQEINFTNAGNKQITIKIGSGNFTDSYSENVKLYSLGIQQYFNYVKNGTTRIIDFLVKNDWVNLTSNWNISNPSLANAVNLSQNESLIVVIEQDYSQGKKDVSINAYNGTFLEDNRLDSFSIKQVGINSLQTLFENKSAAIVNAFVVNNIQPLDVSWRLNNTQELITSNQNLNLNTSEQAIVVIESNFSVLGVYPLNFLINSSTYNDNQTGVAVT